MSYRLEPEYEPREYTRWINYAFWALIAIMVFLVSLLMVPMIFPVWSHQNPFGYYCLGFGIMMGLWIQWYRNRWRNDAHDVAKTRNAARAEINNDSTKNTRLHQIEKIYGHNQHFRFAIHSHPNWREKDGEDDK